MTDTSIVEVAASEKVQQEAWRLLSSSVAPEVASALGICMAERKGSLFHAARHISLPHFNKVHSLGIDGDLTDDDIDCARRWLKEKCPEPSFAMIPPIAHHHDLDGRMASHGFARYPLDFAILHLASAADVARPTGDVDVRAVSLDEASSFGEILCEGYGLDCGAAAFSSLIGRPGLTAYIAWHGEVAMGAGALLVSGGWGWLWLAATRPAFRKRGVQSALLARRIADGRARGVHTFNVGVSHPLDGLKESSSYRNVRRAGFVPAYRRPNYMLASERVG